MEIKSISKLIRTYLIFILICALVGAVAGYFVSDFLTQGFAKSQTFYLVTQKQAQTPESTSSLTDSAIGILTSPEFTQEVRNSSPDTTLDVRKIAPQVIKITSSSGETISASSALRNSQDIFNSKIKNLDDKILELREIGLPLQATYSSYNKSLLTLTGALLGLLFAACSIFLKNYYKL